MLQDHTMTHTHTHTHTTHTHHKHHTHTAHTKHTHTHQTHTTHIHTHTHHTHTLCYTELETANCCKQVHCPDLPIPIWSTMLCNVIFLCDQRTNSFAWKAKDRSVSRKFPLHLRNLCSQRPVTNAHSFPDETDPFPFIQYSRTVLILSYGISQSLSTVSLNS
jgi:hypothetical protein